MALPIRVLRCRLAFPECKRQAGAAAAAATQQKGRDVRVRFAPSPTGLLHLGGLRTALYNYLFAKSHGGKFILRVEDTDQTRLVPGATEKLQEILHWVGIIPDEGPQTGGDFGPYIQSERIQFYKENIKTLLENESAYYCFCSAMRLSLLRKEALRQQENPKYDNKCRDLTKKEIKEKMDNKVPYVVRLKLDANQEPFQDLVYGSSLYDTAANEGDPILMKTDQFPTYHFANVVDDHHMKISHVLRGEEWHTSTHKHLQLYKAFGWQPPEFAHLPLLLNRDGTKLSKRQGDMHMEHFKDSGYFPESILNFVTYVGGGFSVDDTKGMWLDQLIDKFSLDKMRRNAARVEIERLDGYNSMFLSKRLQGAHRQQLIQELTELLKNKLENNRLSDGHCEAVSLENHYVGTVLDWAVGRITKVRDLERPEFEFLWQTPQLDVEMLHQFCLDLHQVLESTLCCLDTHQEPFTKDEIAMLLKDHAKKQGLKFSTYMQLLRRCLSGLKDGPAVAEMITILGKKITTDRLTRVLWKLRQKM